jgi:cardiolipin synthase
LRAAANDGVDVRLLVPGRGSDVAFMQAVSRAGYRPLLDAGIRVFEWKGPMLHAKTAVADARWARVGSTNLNITSWMGNWELDIVMEDEGLGRAMEQMYLSDLEHATEIVLERRKRVRPVGGTRMPRQRGVGGRGRRAAASALRISNAVGSALAARRVIGPAEQRLMVQCGLALTAFAVLAVVWPRLVAWPLGFFGLWLAAALLLRARRSA